ncbi:MAG TPA: hypothetical protein VK994_03320 [Bacteroidales bacterium]|nr:hypothetical protein [Bacteroidales bacterium]
MYRNNIILLAIAMIFGLQLLAQDNHYWWMKAGGEASLMAGAAIAGSRDNSAIFYNPGALGFIDDLSISVNASVYMAQLTRLNNAAGDGLNLKQWRYTYFPQMLSGMLPFKKLDRWRFSYTLMSRYNSYYRFNILHVDKIDVVDEIEGLESYIGNYEFFNEIDEQWGGLGVAYRISDVVSVGLTAFASYRNQFYQQNGNARTVPYTDTNYFLLQISDYDNIKYINWRLLFKIGLALDYEHWKIGFTVTTPSVSIYGDADVQHELSIINFDRLVATLDISDLLAIDRQTGLNVHNRSPLSLAGGIRYEFPKTKIELSTEYFFGLDPYVMIEAEPRPFIYPEELLPEEIQKEFKFLSVYDYKNHIFNAAIGLEQTLSEKVDMLCGLHTDFNFRGNRHQVVGDIIPSSTWDLYHVTAGINYNMKSSRITIGADYYFGMEDNMPQILNFSTPKDYLGLTGIPKNNANARVHGISGIIGFTYFFSGDEKSSFPF